MSMPSSHPFDPAHESVAHVVARDCADRTPYFAAVREAWRALRDEREPRGESLAIALSGFARDGRARGVSVASLLRALDSLIRPDSELDAQLDFARVREWAGTQVIRAYYRVD